MKEKALRRRVITALKPLHAISVENDVFPGTPDVNYVHGWIELKVRDSWPMRPDTNVSLPHFTQQQRLFLSERHRAGGRVHLILVVAREWLLFKGDVAATWVGRVSRSELYDWALAVWCKSPTNKELLRVFS